MISEKRIEEMKTILVARSTDAGNARLRGALRDAIHELEEMRRGPPAPAARCVTCKDRGDHPEDTGTDAAQVYCECPIGAALSAAWKGTGHEEETVAAIEAMRVFLLAALGPDPTKD